MIEITCTDTLGQPLTHLTQWDVNQIVYLRGIQATKAPLVHFCNAKSQYALSVQSTLSSGVISAKIPNILLQENLPIFIYVCQEGSANSSKSTHCARIRIVPKTQPNDYIYVDNIDGVNIRLLDAQVKQLMLDVKTIPNQAVIEGNHFNFYRVENENRTLLFSTDISDLL